MNTDQTLNDRQGKYGEFSVTANTAQTLKEVMRGAENWDNLDDDMKESLDHIATKTARILSGDPDYPDNWHDIAGYARLVECRLDDMGKVDANPSAVIRLTSEEHDALITQGHTLQEVLDAREKAKTTDQNNRRATRQELIQQLTKLRTQLLKMDVSEKSFQQSLFGFEKKHG